MIPDRDEGPLRQIAEQFAYPPELILSFFLFDCRLVQSSAMGGAAPIPPARFFVSEAPNLKRDSKSSIWQIELMHSMIWLSRTYAQQKKRDKKLPAHLSGVSSNLKE